MHLTPRHWRDEVHRQYGSGSPFLLLDAHCSRGYSGLRATFFGLEVRNNVFAKEPQRVFHLRIRGRPGLEDRHNLVSSHALVVFHHLDALIRGADTETTGGEDFLGADTLTHLGIPLHAAYVMAVAIGHILGVYTGP